MRKADVERAYADLMRFYGNDADRYQCDHPAETVELLKFLDGRKRSLSDYLLDKMAREVRNLEGVINTPLSP